ncbi:MAG TPA: alpha/beta fold hydrolase, partial [Bosea sp. (in: a-proteobacteria)]
MSVTELPVSDTLFPGFRLLDVATSGARIRVRTGGEGPALLLLHGYPQTHLLWHKLAERLKHRFTIVCADLRGYGDSDKPASDAEHSPYSKRAMALDMAQVMTALGHHSFMVGAHDRGARVA